MTATPCRKFSRTEVAACAQWQVPGFQHSLNRLGQPQAVYGSKAVSLAKDGVTCS